MKKSFVIILILFVLVSCGNGNDKVVNKIKNPVLEINQDNLNQDIYKKALSSLDEKYCKQIKGDDSLVDSCWTNLYFDKAILEGDVEICKKLEISSAKGIVDTCIMKVNRKLGIVDNRELNTSKCDYLKGEGEKENCKNLIYFENAKLSLDEKYCENIKGDENLADTCWTHLYFDKAIFEGDVEICKKLEISSAKGIVNNCIKKVNEKLGVATKIELDVSKCDSLKGKGEKENCKNLVFFENAKLSLDEKYCKNINGDENLVDSCWTHLYFDKALLKLDVNICKKLKISSGGESLINDCITNVNRKLGEKNK